MYDRLREFLFAHGLDEVAVWIEVLRAPFVLGVRDGVAVWIYMWRHRHEEVPPCAE